MSSFHLQDLVNAHKFQGNPYLHFTRHLTDDGEPIPKYFLKQSTPEYFWCASHQVTMYPTYTKSLLDILNERGLELLSRLSDLYLVEGYKAKAEFPIYYLIYSNSGSWFADTTSPYFDGEVKGSLNSFQNIAVCGKVGGKWLTTSPCIFINENWCFTKSGSFYKLGKLTSMDECVELTEAIC